MKDHKKKKNYLYDLEGPIQDVFDRITREAGDLIDPRIVEEYGYDDRSFYIEGWVPMTEKEIADAKRAALLAKDRKRKKELEQAEYELVTVHALAKKHGLTILDD